MNEHVEKNSSRTVRKAGALTTAVKPNKKKYNAKQPRK